MNAFLLFINTFQKLVRISVVLETKELKTQLGLVYGKNSGLTNILVNGNC